MLRDPLAVKKLLLTTCGQKYLQNPKNLEPLDHILVGVKVCACVCVKVSVKVCVLSDVVVECR